MRRVRANAPVNPNATPTADEDQSVTHKHFRDVLERSAQREPDSDLASPLRNRVGDDAVDSDQAEQQRHAARDG